MNTDRFKLVIEKQAIGSWLLALSKFGDWASWLLKSIRGEGKPALWLGLRPQEIRAEQIPHPYSRADDNARSCNGVSE